jgi:hypothetical protein
MLFPRYVGAVLMPREFCLFTTTPGSPGVEA